MKIIRDIDTFEELTGSTFNFYDLKKLGIPSQFADTVFARNELPKLQEFCARNEGFHILSRIAPFVIVNCIHPRALHFHLGNGSTDPSLCYYEDRVLDPHAWKTSEHLKMILEP